MGSPSVQSALRIHASSPRRASGEDLVPRALPARTARQSSRVLSETVEVLRAQRAEAPAAQSSAEAVSFPLVQVYQVFPADHARLG